MASSLCSLLSLFATLLLVQTLPPAEAQTSSDSFVHSRAAYYPNSDQQGTDSGTCGFGSFGATINGGDVSAASDLYRNGVGCGACYQVRCTNATYCSDKGVTIVITDQGSSDRTDFILSKRAFARMAQTTDAAASLLNLGVVDIEYRRVSCSYPSKNITFKIEESSNYPHYLAFVVWYQQGKKDITAVQLCETQNIGCKLLDRSHGAVWTTTSPPSGPLSIRMLFSDGEDESWVVPINNISQDWKAGETYDSGVQIRALGEFLNVIITLLTNIKTLEDITPHSSLSLTHTATTPTHDSKHITQQGKYLHHKTRTAPFSNTKATSEDQAEPKRNARV